MKQIVAFLMISALWVCFTFNSHAEVSIHKQKITAHLKRTSLSEVLKKICRQAEIDITILNELDYHEAVVSDVLENVPIEQGLERLLNGWNYGLSKDSMTGTIRKLMIVSRRTGVIDTQPIATHFQTISNRLEEKDPDFIEEPNISDLSRKNRHLTKQEVLDNAHPEEREMILQMLEQTEEQ